MFEVFAHMSGLGAHARSSAVLLLASLQARATVVATSAALFQEAVLLYAERQDKKYSLTDCLSMVVCRNLGIQEVLSGDHHFE